MRGGGGELDSFTFNLEGPIMKKVEKHCSKPSDVRKVSRIFLNTLAFDLMKEYFAPRARIPSLPSDILKIQRLISSRNVESYSTSELTSLVV